MYPCSRIYGGSTNFQIVDHIMKSYLTLMEVKNRFGSPREGYILDSIRLSWDRIQ